MLGLLGEGTITLESEIWFDVHNYVYFKKNFLASLASPRLLLISILIIIMKDPDKLTITWTSQDIINQAKDGMDLNLSLSQARKILRFLDRTNDSSQGINWYVINDAIIRLS